MQDPRPMLQNALKDAMKNRDNVRRDVIRMAQSAIKQQEVDSRKALTPEDVVSVLQKEAKQRRETIDELVSAGREDMAEEEKTQLEILEEFLPKQLSDDELRAIVQEVIDQIGASSPKEMGKVMGPTMQRVKGLADGNDVNRIVRELLSD